PACNVVDNDCDTVAPLAIDVVPASDIVPPDQAHVPDANENVPVPPTVPPDIEFAPVTETLEPSATCTVPPAICTCPNSVAAASVNVPALNRTVPVAAAPPKLPEFVPAPACNTNVPLFATTVPSLSTGALIEVLFPPPDLVIVPALWIKGAGAVPVNTVRSAVKFHVPAFS